MADHTVETEIDVGAGWVDLPVYDRDGITVVRGAGGEGQESPPTSVTMTVDNRTRAYSVPRRNAPVRVVLDGSTRATVEASSWKPDQAMGDDPDAWAELDAGGILRRLQQGKTPLRAPFYRAVLADGPVVFWPMDEGQGATQWSSGVVDGDPVALIGTMEFGALAGPAGAAGLSFTDMAASTGVGEVAMPALTPAAWGFEYLLYLKAPDESIDGGLSLVRWDASGDVGRDGWSINASWDTGSLGYYVRVTGSFYASSLGFNMGEANLAPGWHHVRFQARQNGANVDLQMWVDGIDSLGVINPEATPGTLGVPGPLTFGADTGSDPITNMVAGVGMLAFYNGTVPDHSAAAIGYIGELAGERFLRVLGEEGVPAVVVGDETDTQPMGAQPSAKLLDIVRQCVRTDDGMLFEPADQVALAMRTGRSRYNQASVLDLVWTTPGIAPPLRPVYDDKPTFNDVTAKNWTGGEARAVQETGPLNVQDPIDDPDGVGRIDTTVEVSTSTDDVLLSHATWHLAKGTVPAARYPQIIIDLDDNPALTATVNAIDIGDKLTLGALPTDWATEPVPMLLVGVRDQMPGGAGHKRRKVTLVTTPADPYEVLLAGATDGSVDLRGMRVGTTTSTVDGSHVAGDTTILIDSAGIEWTTSAADFNPALNGGGMFLELDGEVVRVTSIAGAGSAWTLTVLRGQSGTAAHTIPDGAPVRFRYPGRIGL